ncbi:MAG: GNAT family N-acetyltransferase [Actinomycetota bacterium]
MSPPPVIRLASEADAPGVAAIYAPIVARTPISFEIDPPTVEEIAARIGGVLPAHPWLVAEAGERPGERSGAGEQVAGFAYARPYHPRAAYRWSVETSLYVAERHRGEGFGRVLYQALFALLAAQGFRQAIAGSVVPNPPSIALHESCGFVSLGVQRRIRWKLGAWHDVVWMQKEIIGGDSPPEAPVPVDQLPESVVAQALQVAPRR